MDEIRVACVRYLNTAPLVEGLEKSAGLRLIPAVPSRIAPMVLAGEADVGLASLVDAVREDLCVLPCGMIGSDGATLTVRVFSSVPLDAVRRLHADTDSHTSVVLARLLLQKRFGARVEVVDFDVRERVERGTGAAPREDWPETVLLIGDKVVTDAPSATHPHQLDLGEAWRAWTGLPFVYAAWMCRAGAEGSDRVRLASDLLERQRRHNRTRLDWIVGTRAPAARWDRAQAAEYLGRRLQYDLGPREREAAQRFADEAAGAGLLDAKRLAWAG